MKEFANLIDAEEYISSFARSVSADYDYITWNDDALTRFFLVNNDLPLLVKIIKSYFFVPNPYQVHIVELAFNINNLKINFKGIERFKGLGYDYFNTHNKPFLEYANKYPQLKMKEKYDEWNGWLINYAIVQMDSCDGTKEYGVGYFSYLPSKFLRELERLLNVGTPPGNGSFYYNDRFSLSCAYKSWKGEERDKRFEKHARYFVLSTVFKEKMDILQFSNELLTHAYKGEFDGEAFSTYIHPVNKWISEERIFKLCQKIYGKKNVVYQYRPSFLKSPKNGQMSYDIFIPSLNIAIEYQGIQHFKPIDYFGGEKSFYDLVLRDEIKKQLSKDNNVKLIYIYHDEIIDEHLIVERIDKILGR